MTLAEIEAMESNTLTVKQAAEFLRCDPQLIRDEAEKNPKYLGFQIAKIGHSYRIPREAFVNWAKGQVPVVKWPWTYEQMKALIEGMKEDRRLPPTVMSRDEK